MLPGGIGLGRAIGLLQSWCSARMGGEGVPGGTRGPLTCHSVLRPMEISTHPRSAHPDRSPKVTPNSAVTAASDPGVIMAYPPPPWTFSCYFLATSPCPSCCCPPLGTEHGRLTKTYSALLLKKLNPPFTAPTVSPTHVTQADMSSSADGSPESQTRTSSCWLDVCAHQHAGVLKAPCSKRGAGGPPAHPRLLLNPGRGLPREKMML